MGIDVNAMLTELGIQNVDKEKLTEAANKALEALTKAQERLDAANQALANAEENPDVVAQATELVEAMSGLGVGEKVIRAALRAKFDTHRAPKPDNGVDLTDELKAQMRAHIDASGTGGFKTSDLVALVGAKRDQVSAWVKSLVEASELTKRGQKRGTKYYLAEMAPAWEAIDEQAA